MVEMVRYAARCIWRRPLQTGGIVLSLALGIGINTAVFSFLDQLLLRPLSTLPEASRLLTLYSMGKSGGGYLPISYPNYLDLVERCRNLSGIAAFQAISVGLSGQPRSEQVAGEMVSANYFQVLGAKTVLGRTFSPEEGRIPGGQPVVVLANSFWRRRFAADPGVLERSLVLNGTSFKVIGVAEKAYRGTSAMNVPDLWVPLSFYRQVFAAPDFFAPRSGRILQLVARLRDGIDPQTAQAEIAGVGVNLAREYPDDNRDQEIVALPLAQANIHPNTREIFAKGGFLLAAVAGILLLTACANIANLLLVRNAQRKSELAIRFALGSNRGQLVRLLLIESLILGLLGGLVSLAVGAAAWWVIWKFRPPFLAESAVLLRFDPRLLAYTVLLSLATVLVFGLLPALAATRGTRRLSFRDGPDGLSRNLSLRDGIVAVQLALSTICLACSGLFINDLLRMGRIDPGFDADHLLSVSFDLKTRNYSEPAGRAVLDRALARVRVLPGVRSAGLGENPPLGGFRLLHDVLPAAIPTAEKVLAGSSVVDASYFQTMGIPIVIGRSFQQGDAAGSVPVVVINEALKERFWPDRSPVGELLQLPEQGKSLEIVGVARNAKYITLAESPRPVIYLPLSQLYRSRCSVHVRAAGDPAALLRKVEDAVAGVDPDLPLVDVRTAQQGIARTLWAPRLTTILLVVFGFLALALATIGVYSVTAVNAARRRSEIGIRMALGAGRLRVVTFFLGRGLVTLGVGTVGGLLGAAALVRWLESSLLGAEAGKALCFVLVASALLLAGFCATALPALRAARADPVLSLRGE